MSGDPVDGGPLGPVIPLAAPEVLTVDEAAAFLRISRTSLYDAIGRGDVPHQRLGRQIRLHRSALVRWLSGSCGAASETRA